jgi:cell division protein FtsI/penicillin-binding protein 2
MFVILYPAICLMNTKTYATAQNTYEFTFKSDRIYDLDSIKEIQEEAIKAKLAIREKVIIQTAEILKLHEGFRAKP